MSGKIFSLFGVALMLFSLVSTTLLSVPDAKADTGFMAGRIIDDSVFTDYGTMSVSNIQFFLNSKGVNCVNGQAPCLKNFNEGGRSAAQIIFDTAQEFRINPQTLIVVLQKETALVTISQPASWRYRTAMGYGCPDTAACDSEYYGFTNQMRWAARMYRAIMNASPTWYTPYVVGNNYIQWNPNSACGGTNVYIQNRATQALYNYTPYQPNAVALNAGYGTGDACSAYGNRNFYLYFKDWFGGSRQSPIVRSPSSPTYYLLTNNKKYAIPSGDILYAYGLESAPLSVVSDVYLSTITDGGMLDTIYTVPGDNTVFLADSGKKHGIASGEYCTRWGLACGNTNVQKVIGPEIAGLLRDGGVLQPVMKFAGQYYLMENGKKKQFLGEQSMTERGFGINGSTNITSWTNATRPFDVSLPSSRSFVKFGASSAIYLYSDGSFFSFPNYESFVAWFGTGFSSYFDTTSAYNTTPPTVAGFPGTLLTNNGTVSALKANQQIVLTGAQPSVTPFDITQYPQLKSMISGRPTKIVTSDNALAFPNGSISALTENTLRPIPTMTDLRLSYTEDRIVSAPMSVAGAYPVGKLAMIPGRIFKPSDSGAMYLYGADKKLWALGSQAELNSTLKWTDTVVTSSFSNIDFSDVKVFPQMVKVYDVPYVVYPDGWLKRIPLGSIATPLELPPVEGNMLQNMKFNTVDIQFVRFEDGMIAKVNATEIQPISSMSIYNSLGGNASNTAQLPTKARSVFNIGTSL